MKKNIPNILTSIRIIMTPFIIYFSAIDNLKVAIILIIVASITDMLDGFIARTFNFTSDFGAKLDTIADKLFAGCLIISIILKKHLFLLCLIGETLIATINIISFIQKKKPYTKYIGKIKTIILFITIILGFLSLIYSNLDTFVNILIIISFVFQIISCICYINYYFNFATMKTKRLQ